MRSSTVQPTPPETRESVDPSAITGRESTHDPRLPSRRGRRRRSRGNRLHTVKAILLRILVVIATALAFLILWQETAYSQDPPRPESSVVKPESVQPAKTPSPESTPSKPNTVEEWVRQLKSKDGKKKAGSSEDVEAPPGAKTPMAQPPRGDPAKSVAPPSGQKTPAPAVGSGEGPTNSPAAASPASLTTAKAMDPIDASSLGEDMVSQLDSSKALSEIPDRELLWHSSLDLILALEREFEFVDPPLVPETLETHLKAKLLELSFLAGTSDNPRENLEALRVYLSDTLGYAAVERETPDLEMLLPRFLLSEKRASPLCLAMVTLALADHLSKYLELEPITVAGLLGLRYRSGFHRYIVVPSYLDRLYSDDDFVRAAYGGESPSDATITVLTRKEFWAMVVGAAGASLGQTDQRARAEQLLRRSLALNPRQAPPRIALAHLLRQQRQFAAAREELDRALELEHDHTLARLARVEVLNELGLVAEVEKDLEWLFHRRSHERAGVQLIRHYLDRRLFGAAQREWQRLSSLPTSTLADGERRALELEVGAAPWIERLIASDNDRDRFLAIDQLGEYPIDAVENALLTVMQDSNLRLATYAWNQLRKLTSMDLPRDPARWRAALARRKP